MWLLRFASGDIVDFAQAAEWQRFTKNTTPISFDNEVAYDHYQVLLRASLPTTAKQKAWVKPRAKYFGFGISSIGISLKNSPIIFGTIMILVGSAARSRYNHIADLPVIRQAE